MRPDALNPYRNSFNAIRLLAALQVVYVHSVAHLELPRGAVFKLLLQFPGVPIFFAVSGFLVLDSFMRQRSMGSFATARALRIYPGLAANVLTLELLFALGGGMALATLSPIEWIRFETVFVLTASQDWARAAVAANPYSYNGWFPRYPSGVLWTLTVELTFYLIVPILGTLALGRRYLATIAYVALAIGSVAFVISTAGRYPSTHWISNIRLTVVPYFWMFSIGMIFRLWWTEITSIKFGLPVVASIFVAFMFKSDFSWIDWKYQPDWIDLTKAGLVCIFVVWLGTTPVLKSAIFVKHDISYGVYLWHMLFVTTAMALGWTGTFWTMTFILSATFFTAWLSWLLIEHPAQIAGKRRRVASAPLS